ncbi:hypothetical protein [Arthrobacter woluwensis]|uniref:hypothetical protein n=1 Tax=Arthrobacter woluwensis TaxID=156980 RepID=UPI0011A3451B|nr:hypothetical protein [Arthrobacter woluwensis]
MRKTATRTMGLVLTVASIGLGVAAPAQANVASPASVQICDGPSPVYTFGSKTVSSRPTNVKSAYITGPGTLSYNKTVSAQVGMSATATVTAEAGVVLAKASTSLGVSVSANRTWTDGFTYTLNVPSGQRRAMQLFQTSRAFTVTKQVLRTPCTYVTAYANNAVNAPLTQRQDEWKLVP